MSYLTIRVDSGLRTAFAKFCDMHSLTASQVVKLFVLYYIRTQDASFCFKVDANLTDVSDKTETMAIWLGSNHRQAFTDKAVPNMSALIRGYMRYCVVHGIPSEILSYQDARTANREMIQQQVDKLQTIELPLSAGGVDDGTAKQFASELAVVRAKLGDVMDTI